MRTPQTLDDSKMRPEVEMVKVGELREFGKNSRKHSSDQIAQIAKSIASFGWTKPVITDERLTILAGHGAVKAAESLGMTHVPVIRRHGLTDAQKRGYVIADNKIPLNAEWDFGVLRDELTELDTGAFDMSVLGFSPEELESIGTWAPDGSLAGNCDADETPEPPAVAASRTGDVWILGKHRILCGDSTKADDVKALLGDVKPLLMVTDPPYGVEYDADWRNRAGLDKGTKITTGKVKNDDRADWRSAWRLFDGDVVYIWHGERQLLDMGTQLKDCGFELRNLIVWGKPHFALSRGHYHSQHETCWYAVRKGGTGHWGGNHAQSTLWQIENGSFQGRNKREDADKFKSGHSTQKPVECMRRPIENNSAPGQAVYEPFSGSGTTIIAAEQTNRACYAIELNPVYVDVAVLRWQKFSGGIATLESDGRTFAEIASERVKVAA